MPDERDRNGESLEGPQEREPAQPAQAEQSEEDKVRELWGAYKANGKEGIREVLRRRDEEYLKAHRSDNRATNADPSEK